MDFSGLVARFPTNRLLSAKEKAFHLKQKKQLNVEPHYQLSVIKMNSTFLEIVDKWYGWKGLVSMVAIFILSILSSTLGMIAFEWLLEGIGLLPSDIDPGILLANGAGMAIIFFLFSWLVLWLLLKESFAYTHYPMRFDRKARTVHIFRTDGTVLSVSWEKIHFTVVNVAQWNDWEVRGHILDSDEITVRETFALSYSGSLNPADANPQTTEFSTADFVRAHWEFVRRYMEDGPQEVSSQVQFCMPVDKHREGFRVGAERVFSNFAAAPLVLYCLVFPFCVVVIIFRWLAMMTSKVPHWPDDIEASTKIENNDPYAIEATSTGERVAVFPEAAQAAGVRFYSHSPNSEAAVEAVEQR
jgi:hypothetical protein